MSTNEDPRHSLHESNSSQSMQHPLPSALTVGVCVCVQIKLSGVPVGADLDYLTAKVTQGEGRPGANGA